MIGSTLGHFRITDKLVEALVRSINERSINAVYTPVIPAYYASGLKEDLRNRQLMKRLGFPEAGEGTS